jgi:hypothetical protein
MEEAKNLSPVPEVKSLPQQSEVKKLLNQNIAVFV